MQMLILKLDDINTQVAALVYKSVPLNNWVKAVVTARHPHNESTATISFDFHKAENTVERSLGFDDLSIVRLSQLFSEHQQLVQKASQPRWYKMIVIVHRDGKFNVDFEYNDNYQEGDIMKRG